jgi:hypothetical protein
MKILGITASRDKGFNSYQFISGHSDEWICENAERGLPEIYNIFVNKHIHGNYDAFMFSHDDVYLKNKISYVESEVSYRFEQGYDVLGVAGTSEYTIQEKNLWHLSNSNNHSVNVEQGILNRFSGGKINNKKIIDYYELVGYLKNCKNVPSRCLILDGCFLIVSKKVFESGIRFDEQFKFHHYDMDFCLQCNEKGFKMTTCLIDIVHLSPGLFSMEDEEWKKSNEKFINKWK